MENLLKGYLLNAAGKKVKLSSTIDANESKFLFDFIVNIKEIQSVLEIGCDHGLSSLTITSVFENRIGSKHHNGFITKRNILEPGDTII